MTTTRSTLARTLGCCLAALAALGITACSQDSKEFTRAEPATTASAQASPSATPSATGSATPAVATSAATSRAARPSEQAVASQTATAARSEVQQARPTASQQTWYRSSSGLYRSRNKACITAEENWQEAVRANKKSAAEAAHDSALDNGCDPAVWTPNGAKHETVSETHYDGEACTESRGGTIAVFDDTYAVCTQQVEGVWAWEVAER